MLTIRSSRLSALGLAPGALVLDAGAGFGRHAFELARQGARVVALDYAADEVAGTKDTFAAMVDVGEINATHYVGALRGDATRLPFAPASFDAVITSEVLEHIPDDTGALAELVRILKPGGVFAATVPTWLPEKINWMLSDEYHAPAAVGVNEEDHPLVRRYRSFLEWDIVQQPRSTRVAERVLSPVLGKSLVLYATKAARA